LPDRDRLAQVHERRRVTAETVIIRRYNAVYDQVFADPGVTQELRDHFSFEVPGAKFHPAVKYGHWDGIKRLYGADKKLYRGLRDRLIQFCADRNYDVDAPAWDCNAVNPAAFAEWCKTIVNPKYTHRDYQLEACLYAIENLRAVMLSPTASGKSLIIYTVLKHFNLKTMVIVPTQHLVLQMRDDFIDYGMDPDDIHTVMGGVRESTKPVTITTWHSAWKEDPEFLEQFQVVIGDEAHGFTAKSMGILMEKLVNAEVRLGFTGTLGDSKTNPLVLEGLFGPVKEVTTTKELMDEGHVSQMNIRVIALKHPEPVRKTFKKLHSTWPDELKYLEACPKRNEFLINLAMSLEGNTIMLFRHVEHGKLLYEMAQERIKNAAAEWNAGTVPEVAKPWYEARMKKGIHLVYGGVDKEDRNEIRYIVEQAESDLIIASY